MPAGSIQLDSLGRRRLRTDGKRILAEDAPCCCLAPCVDCPDDLASTYFITGHFKRVDDVSGVTECEADFSGVLTEGEPCIWYFSEPFPPCPGTLMFDLRRSSDAGFCGFAIVFPPDFGVPSEYSLKSGNNPIGSYPTVVKLIFAKTITISSLVVS